MPASPRTTTTALRPPRTSAMSCRRIFSSSILPSSGGAGCIVTPLIRSGGEQTLRADVTRPLLGGLQADGPFLLDAAEPPDEHGAQPGGDEHPGDDEPGGVDVEMLHDGPEAVGAAEATDLLGSRPRASIPPMAKQIATDRPVMARL